MRYGVFTDVVEGRFVKLLVDSWGCRICESGGVGRPYFTARCGGREGFDGAIRREAISAHDIGFCGAVDVNPPGF